MRFNTSYMDKALFDLPLVIEQARIDLADVDYDTLVGTGLSGAVVVPSLALALGKDFLLLRKDADDSHHGGNYVGTIGERWLFVDDFICSGATHRRVMDQMRALPDDIYWRRGCGSALPPVYVGVYLYENRGGGYVPAEFTTYTDE